MMTQIDLISNNPPETSSPMPELPVWLQKVIQVTDRSINMLVGGIFISPIVTLLPSARSTLPKTITWLSEAFLAVPCRGLRSAVVGLLPSVCTTFKYGLKLKTNWTFICVGSSIEEIIFRYCIQSLLLTEAPRFIIQKVAPSYEHLVDCKIAKIARVVFTSQLFALAHIVRLGNVSGMLLPQFLASIYLSYLRENGTSITELSSIHILVNVVSTTILGGLRQ